MIDLSNLGTLGMTEIVRLQNQLQNELRRRFERSLLMAFSDIVGSTPYFARFGDAVGRLRARGIRHPPDREVRQPLGDVRLDVDDGAVEPGQRHRPGAPEPLGHDPTPTTWRSTAGRPGRQRMPTTSTRTWAARSPPPCPAR